MQKNAERNSSETFIVWNENINLVGSLISTNEGKSSVWGMIRFKDGRKISFSSEQGNAEVLHQRLSSVCQQIAEVYGTNVVCGKDRGADSLNETSVLLNNLLPLLN